MRTNYMARELHVQIAIVGPLGSGKRTVMEIFHHLAPPRGKPHWPDRINDAILAGAIFFDFLPPKLGSIRGFSIRVELRSTVEPEGDKAIAYAVEGSDAIVFMADSQTSRREANIAALARARSLGMSSSAPCIFVFNKRDLPDVASVEELRRDLDVGERPAFEGVATEKVGAVEAVKAALGAAIIAFKASKANDPGPTPPAH